MRKIIILIMLLILLPSIYAITCDVNNEPVFNTDFIDEDKIFVLCSLGTNTTSYCYSYVNESTTLIQSNPEPVIIDKVGMDNQYFENKNGLVNAYYTNRNLLVYHNYTVTLKCAYGNGTTESTDFWIVPQYENWDKASYRMVWTKNNMSYFVGVIVMIIVFFCFILIIWRVVF